MDSLISVHPPNHAAPALGPGTGTGSRGGSGNHRSLVTPETRPPHTIPVRNNARTNHTTIRAAARVHRTNMPFPFIGAGFPFAGATTACDASLRSPLSAPTDCDGYGPMAIIFAELTLAENRDQQASSAAKTLGKECQHHRYTEGIRPRAVCLAPPPPSASTALDALGFLPPPASASPAFLPSGRLHRRHRLHRTTPPMTASGPPLPLHLPR